ncbi:hypothetical protein D3C81_2090650 [compost metagenome]
MNVFSKVTWTCPSLLFKKVRKISLICKAQFKGNFFDGPLGALQKTFGFNADPLVNKLCSGYFQMFFTQYIQIIG